MVARDGDPAAKRPAEVLEPAYIVALPAVQGDGNFRERFERAAHVHAERSVAFTGETEGGCGGLGARHGDDV